MCHMQAVGTRIDVQGRALCLDVLFVDVHADRQIFLMVL
jgi:hypothetical protein